MIATPLAVLAVPQSDTVAVIGSPRSGVAEVSGIVAAAGGTILGVGRWQNIVIARADTAGFVGRLYGAGARLVLDGRLARFCGRTPSDAKSTLQAESGPRIPKP